MRPAWIKTFISPRAALAVLAGLMLAGAFPTTGQASLAWLAPGLMLLSGLGTTGRRAFAWGYLAGLVHYLISLRWLLNIPFPAGAAPGWLALGAYLALYPACWVWLCTAVFLRPANSKGGLEAPEASTRLERLERALAPLLAAGWTQRTVWCLLAAATWVALEMVVARLFTGFPWNFLGVSQYQVLPLIQIAAATGVYGVSFVVAWCSTALACAGVAVCGQCLPRPVTPSIRARSSFPSPLGASVSRSLLVSFRFTLAADLALPLVALLLITLAGALRLAAPPLAGPELRVAVVQPSIPQRLIFDARESTNRFNAIMELTGLALAVKPDLLVWPEASLPGFEESHYRALTNLIASHRVWMVFGADDVEPLPGAMERPRYRYFNSAFLFNPAGQFTATYRKRNLVIFGEYIPLERWLPLAKFLTPIQASYTPGPGPAWFDLANPRARIAPLICFEDVFPATAREAVDDQTDFLLNLTNNGWFGESAAQWQQAANAVFRAVENRVPLVRCTNNGLTCWIDIWGRLREVGFDGPKDVYGPGFKIFRLPLRPAGSANAPTFYRRHGDLFGWLCVAWTVAAIGLARLKTCARPDRAVTVRERGQEHRTSNVER